MIWPYNKQIILSSFENFEQNGKTADWNACGDSNYVKNMGETWFPLDVLLLNKQDREGSRFSLFLLEKLMPCQDTRLRES